MIALDLSEQTTSTFCWSTNNTTNFTENLKNVGNTIMFFILTEVKKIILSFSQEIVKVLETCSLFILLRYNIIIKMTQYNIVNIKLSNSQLKNLKSATKNETEVTLKLLLNIIGNLNNEVNSPYQLLLAEQQVPKLCKNFANDLSANIKLWKTGPSKMTKSGGFLHRLLWPLLKTVLW